VDYALVYGACGTTSEERKVALMNVTILSYASHAPQGLRGHQGLLALWGNALVRWESKKQPFAALSSTESEVIGYVDAVTIGESLQVVLNILQNNMLLNEGDFLLMGDILSGIHTFAVT